jgi:agmatine deiminase
MSEIKSKNKTLRSPRLPAEWEPHEATWIGWPHNKSDWPGNFRAIPNVYAEIVKHISRSEKVYILVQSSDHKLKAERILNRTDADFNNLKFFIKKTNRGWVRDSGPFFVKEKDSFLKDLSLKVLLQNTMVKKSCSKEVR